MPQSNDALEILTPRTLLGVYRDVRLATVTNYWRRAGGFDRNTHQSPFQKIIFEKIDADRKVAPFVLPQNTGRPTYRRRGSEARSFEPAYIKPRDPVVPSEQFTRRPGNLFDDSPRTPEQNWDAEVAAILEHHRTIIERRWEVMCAQAMIYAKVLVEYEDGPTVEVDYGRDPALTDIKTAGFWDTSTDIPAQLQEYLDAMANAKFGGRGALVTIGREVWRVMRKNTSLLELMDMQMKNSDASFARSLIESRTPDAPWTVVGTLPGLTFVLYEDFYEDNAGNQVDIMNPRDLVISAQDVGGVMAFGAILDAKAGLRPQAVFPKMWESEDPSALNIMTQSAPLPVQVNPNRTFHARVVEEDSNS